MATKNLGLANYAGMVNNATRKDFPTRKDSPAPDKEVSLDLIDAKPQVRTRFNESDLNDLAESIKSIGILQPILLLAKADGRYDIIAGERRFRAARLAGLAKVPVLIKKDLSPAERREMQVAENQQREDPDPYDEMMSVAEDVQVFGMEQATRIWKKSNSWVSKRVGAKEYSADVKTLLVEGVCTDLEILGCLNFIYSSEKSSFEQFVRRIKDGAPIVRLRDDARAKVADLKENQKSFQQHEKRVKGLKGDHQVQAEVDANAEPAAAIDMTKAPRTPTTSGSARQVTGKPLASQDDLLESQLADLGQLVAASMNKVGERNGDTYNCFATLTGPLIAHMGVEQARRYFDRLVSENSKNRN